MLGRLSPNLQGCVYMVIAMFGFTVNDLFVKLLGQSLPIFQIIALRGVIICVFMVAWGVALKRSSGKVLPPLPRQRWPIVSLRALMEVLATILFLLALVRIAFADVSAVMQSLPLAVTFGAAVFLREPVGWRRWSAILIGFIGVIIIIRPGMAGFQPAMLLVAASVLFAAARDLITRTLPGDVHNYWVTAATAVFVAVFGLAATTVLQQWQAINGQQLLLLFAASSFLIVAYQAIILAMRLGEVASVAPFRYTSLVWAMILGYAVFAEVPDKITVFGSVIVVGTGLFAWYRERVLS